MADLIDSEYKRSNSSEIVADFLATLSRLNLYSTWLFLS
jgi:hypothetical protein